MQTHKFVCKAVVLIVKGSLEWFVESLVLFLDYLSKSKAPKKILATIKKGTRPQYASFEEDEENQEDK